MIVALAASAFTGVYAAWRADTKHGGSPLAYLAFVAVGVGFVAYTAFITAHLNW